MTSNVTQTLKHLQTLQKNLADQWVPLHARLKRNEIHNTLAKKGPNQNITSNIIIERTSDTQNRCVT